MVKANIVQISDALMIVVNAGRLTTGQICVLEFFV